MTSLIYRHPLLYALVMKLLYGRNYGDRYRAIARLLPDGAEVIEPCMGDARLYTHYLRKKMCVYRGLDVNPAFVASARRKGVYAETHNLLTDVLPRADYVVLHAALYQFIPGHEAILRKLLRAAKKKLIVAEPVKNLAASSNRIIAALARYGTNPGSGPAHHRFNRKSLADLFRSFPEFELETESAGGREIIGVFGPASAQPR